MTPTPFLINVPEPMLADLRERLGRTRWPDQAAGGRGPSGPTSPTCRSWSPTGATATTGARTRRSSTRSRSSRPRSAGSTSTSSTQPGRGPPPLPLLLSHGWPGSVWEFHKIIPMLTDPARFGGDPPDAFTVVAPSLPGYGFSFPPGQPRFGIGGDRRRLRR